MKYAQMLADKMQQHAADAWLINTGWTGGPYGIGSRIKLAHTRAIIDAIHAGQLSKAPTTTEPVFGLTIPTLCPGVPSEILNPKNTWSKPSAYDTKSLHLAKLFQANFHNYADGVTAEVQAAGPKLVVTVGRASAEELAEPVEAVG